MAILGAVIAETGCFVPRPHTRISETWNCRSPEVLQQFKRNAPEDFLSIIWGGHLAEQNWVFLGLPGSPPTEGPDHRTISWFGPQP